MIFRFLVVATILLFGKAACAEQPARPNIVMIMADDLGFECIGANGGTSYSTPVLDRLADEGMRFNHCYSQPLCTPSRVQLMTGIYNIRNYEKFGVLPKNETTFANVLQDQGYKTCVVGKWQLGKELDLPKSFGFENHCLWFFARRGERYPNPGLEVDGESIDFSDGRYGPDVVSDYACAFMEKNRESPFLIYYPMILTHCPFCPTPDSDDWDPADPGSKTYKGEPKHFGDMVTYMDKTVGKLVNKLDELGLRQNTLILFVGDNGTDKPIVSQMGDQEVVGAKGAMTDGGTHVPFIASWPGTLPSGQVSNDLIDFSDFFPTICDAAKVKVPETLSLDGRSFFQQLTGQPGNPRDWIYVWYSRNGSAAKAKQFARNQRFKLYGNGKFVDVASDPLERAPLAKRTLSDEQRSVHEMLNGVLDRFKDARPARLLKNAPDK